MGIRGKNACSAYLTLRRSWLPGDADGKPSACNAGDPGSVPGLGRSPGEGNGTPLQYSSLENPMDGGACWATSPRGRKQSDTTERLPFHYLALTPFPTSVLNLNYVDLVWNYALFKTNMTWLKLTWRSLLTSLARRLNLSQLAAYSEGKSLWTFHPWIV